MSNWISVEDRLPANNSTSEMLMTYRPDAPRDARVSSLYWDGYMQRWGGSYPVTHWQPLPEPPQ